MTTAYGYAGEPTPVTLVVEAVQRVTGPARKSGKEWALRCPAHEDRNPSLNVSEGRDGSALVLCRAGCNTDDILEAVGLTFADLFADRRAPAPPPMPRKRLDTAYIYVDENAVPLYRVRRLDGPAGKKVWQERAVGGGWVKSMTGARLVPYNFPKVLEAVAAHAPVWIVEGEKCADVLNAAGLVATTNPGGAGKWREEWSQFFVGADLIVIPDHDEPGRQHARQVRDFLEEVANSVRVLSLPDLSKGEDVYDWLAAGRTVEDLVALLDQPDGYVRPADTLITPTWPWPEPTETCFYGIAGKYAQEVTEISEADPMAVLGTLLTVFGVFLGREPHVRIGNSTHRASLFTLIVGESARARKGTALSDTRVLLEMVHPRFFAGPGIVSGISSGEGLVQAMRDAREGEADAGVVHDRRFLAIETEFAKVLQNATRDKNIVSSIIRQAWDGEPLRTTTKADPMTASNYHFGVVGHITIQELRRELTATEAANGFANRHIFIPAKRTKIISRPGRMEPQALTYYAQELNSALNAAHGAREVALTEEAWERYDDIYREVETRDVGEGLALSIITRGAPNILRMALITALINKSPTIEVEHLEAAYAIWNYAEAGVLHIYGDKLGDRYADTLLSAVRQAGDKGITGRDAYRAFSGHVDKDRLYEAAELLVRRGLIQKLEVVKQGAGRPTTVYLAAGLTLSS